MVDKRILAGMALWGFIAASSACAVECSESETNAVVRAMLRPLLVRPRIDGATGVVVDAPRCIWSQDEFFAPRAGWTSEELRDAFDWYLCHLSSSELPAVPSLPGNCMGNPLAEAAMAQCEAMAYTNALPMVEVYARGPGSRSRKMAIDFVLHWHECDQSLLDFFSDVVTNGASYAVGERNAAYRTYTERLLSQCPDACSCAETAFLYDRRLDMTGAVAIDGYLSARCFGYAQSSNRLNAANAILSETNCWRNARKYFSSVTNRLLSTGATLPWIEPPGESENGM